jgi:phytoene synthase
MANISNAASVQNSNYTQSARQSLAKHGKSFSWATQLFPKKMANDVATLYAFCRIVDDIADYHAPDIARRFLKNIHSNLDVGYSQIAEVDAFIELLKRHQIHPNIPQLFVQAIQADIGAVRIKSISDLIRYSYGVAATVGLMMCNVMGVREAAAHPFAIDLGIAMQLTNIARDVVEDAHRDRLYIPAQLLDQDIDLAKIRSGHSVARVAINRSRKRLLKIADQYYRSADMGMRFISFRCRLAIVTAARLYEAIGDQVLSDNFGWEGRAYINKHGKIRQTLFALGSVMVNSDFWHTGPHPVHDPELHHFLAGLPGTHRGHDE